MANVIEKHSVSSELAQKMVNAAVGKARELGVTSIPCGEDHPEPSLVAHHPVVCLLRFLERKRFRHGAHTVHRREFHRVFRING